ncbi:hypothetical protein [Bacillus cereus]|uniref:hypothetical protein n=1 Tax=Bacillus cereus TaxID=1396 RepID=UPI0002792EBE|nr:hypothetical protein [Bacillus cereus]EJQ20149.1 hypothetical protein IE5_03466 [Bacillus cereus BAG3X2-2]PGO94452.1 hypothetical protein COA03_22245 [Bacillus cereus]WMW36763.1 hypothetical protein RE433_17945 [Bacillus cereus]
MKKYLLLLVSVFFSLALVACGSEEKTEEKSAPTASNQKGIKESNSKTNEKTVLTKVGEKQKYNAQGGVIELMKIKEINQTIDVAPIKMTVQNIKLFELSDLPEQMLTAAKEVYQATPTNDGKLNYIQVIYTVENTSDENINFLNFDKVVLNNGEQLEANRNFITEKNTSFEYFGKVKQERVLGLFFNGDPKDITNVKFITSSTYQQKSYDTITDGQQVQFDL